MLLRCPYADAFGLNAENGLTPGYTVITGYWFVLAGLFATIFSVDNLRYLLLYLPKLAPPPPSGL